jgi:hypothetical protein
MRNPNTNIPEADHILEIKNTSIKQTKAEAAVPQP